MELTLLNLEQPTALAVSDGANTNMPISDIGAIEGMFLGVRTVSGVNVTPAKAKRCAAALACMRGISEDLSGLPLNLYKRGKEGDDIATGHPVYRILNVAPNDVMTPIELRERMMFDLFTTGAFFNLINEDPSDPGVLDSVWPLPPHYVTRAPQQLVWNYTDPLTGVRGKFTPAGVWRGTVMADNGIDGVALTLLAREAIGLLLAAEEQAGRLFSQGVQTDLTLSSDDTMDEDQKLQLRAAFMQRHSGSANAWMPLLLEGGLKAARIGLTAQESQFMETRDYQAADVARIFRYPEVLLGGGSKNSKTSTFASAEQFFQSYTKHTLLPWAIRIEQTVNRDLLTRKEQGKYYAKHDFDQLLAADQAARYDSWNKAISGGWMQPSEARRKERMPFKPGLDYFNRAKNMDSLGGASQPAPTDMSGSNELPRRVALHIIDRERKAIVGKKAGADAFYANFGGFIEDLTGADKLAVSAYLDTRRTTKDRFSAEAQDAAIAAILSLTSERSGSAVSTA